MVDSPQPQTRNDRIDDIMKEQSREAFRIFNHNAGLATCVQVAKALDEAIPRFAEFVKELERLGEYGVGAGHIFNIAQTLLAVVQWQRAVLQATIDFAISD